MSIRETLAKEMLVRPKTRSRSNLEDITLSLLREGRSPYKDFLPLARMKWEIVSPGRPKIENQYHSGLGLLEGGICNTICTHPPLALSGLNHRGSKIGVFRVCFRALLLPPFFPHSSALFPLQALCPSLTPFPLFTSPFIPLLKTLIFGRPMI